MCLWFLGLSSNYLFIHVFPLFWLSLFQVQLVLDTLWAQLLLEFSTNHFETMYICSARPEDVRVFLGLSSYYTDLKLTTLY